MGSSWVVVAFCWLGQLYADQSLKPQTAAAQLTRNNPTLTTIALQKPFCVFDSSLHPNKSYTVYLYAMKESASAMSSLVMAPSSKPLDSTFQQTGGGQLGPYRAALFPVPTCAAPPRPGDLADVSKVSGILQQYLFRVEDDGTCLYDPNFLDVCNPPLAPDTTYRFKYVLIDSTEGIVKDQTLWSDPIKTRRVKLPLQIDLWPGPRSGGMVVITSILSVLLFLLLAGFLAAVCPAVLKPEGPSAEAKNIPQTTQPSDPSPQLSPD